MINPGYKITVEDFKTLTEIKKSSVYGVYLKSIAASPVYKSIMSNHINNINVVPDIDNFKKLGLIPKDASSDVINDIFKQTLNKMAISLVADSIILKELEDINIDEIIRDLKDDSELTYLMGLANEKYYDKAQTLLDSGEIDENSLEFKGLLAFNKIKKNKPTKNKKEKIVEEQKFNKIDEDVTDQILNEPKKSKKLKFDINKDDIKI